jgi:hypothetical protein
MEAQEAQEAAHIPDPTEERCEVVLARAFATDPNARPPVALDMNQPCYFVGTLELMRAVAGDDYAYAKNAALAKRIRNAMSRQREWGDVKVRINGVERRGYALRVDDADAHERTTYETTWEAEFGKGSKF